MAITDEMLTGGVDDLPPPGDERTEVLKRRLEALGEEAERLSNEMETHHIDPAKFVIDREVAQHFSSGPDAELYITDADRNYVYTWVYRDPYNKFGGRFVFSMQRDGWERVSGKMIEALEHKSVTGERWVADCLLMRMRRDLHVLYHAKNRAMRRAREGDAAGALQELADRHGVTVHTNVSDMPAHLKSAIGSATAGSMRRGFAKQAATAKFDRALRSGTIPGMPAPGSRS